jgi:dihydroxyacetone kinase
MMDYILNDKEFKKIILMINNLGGTTNLVFFKNLFKKELPIVTKSCLNELKNRSIIVERILVGTFMTVFIIFYYFIFIG